MRKVRNEEEEIPKSVLKMKQDKERREELKNKGEQGKHSNKSSNKKGAKSKNKKDKHKNRFLRKIILILILILLIVGGIALGISAHNWKVLSEAMFTNKMSVVLDKEGEQNEASRTMRAACEMGLHNVIEENSQDSCGLRMADMMAGIISKLLKALCDKLHYHSIAEGPEKKLLDTKWFQLNEAHLNLYKKLYKIVCEWDNAWYKSYAGIYSDDLVCFIGLLGYMAHFENTEQIINEKLEMQSESSLFTISAARFLMLFIF